MNADTTILYGFLQTPAGQEVIVAFLADVGGDPEDYGLEDAVSVTPEHLVGAFGSFMQEQAELVLTREQAAICRSGRVDWSELLARLESSSPPGR